MLVRYFRSPALFKCGAPRPRGLNCEFFSWMGMEWWEWRWGIGMSGREKSYGTEIREIDIVGVEICDGDDGMTITGFSECCDAFCDEFLIWMRG